MPPESHAQYDRGARLKKPAYIKLDRFGWCQLGREHDLTAIDVLLVLALAALCDYRTGDYFGTLTELSEDTRASRRAVKVSIERLAGAELVQVVIPFGPKRQGHLRLLALDRLVQDVAKPNRVDQRESTGPHLEPFRADTARLPRANRAVTASNGANAQAVTSRDARPVRELREEGMKASTVSRDDVLDAVALVKRELGAKEVG